MRNIGRILVASGLALTTLAARAELSKEEKIRLEALEEQVAAMKAGDDKNGSPISLFYKKGIQLKSEDGDFTMKWTGYAIENGRFFAQTSPNDNNFYNKETLFGWSGTFARQFNYNIELVLGPTTGMNNSFVEYAANDAFALRVGQWKVPFLYEETWSNVNRDFAEQSTTKRLAPSRSVGIGVSGKLFEKRLGYELGYFNGEAKNTNDTNDSKEVALRLDVAPFLTRKDSVAKNLHLAVAGTMGLEDAKQPNYGAAGTFSMVDTGTTFLQLNTTARMNEMQRHAVSAYWNHKSAKFIGEFASNRLSLEKNPNDYQSEVAGVGMKNASGNTRIDAWYMTFGYVLTGEEAKINGLIEPKKPFKKGEGGGWGAFEVVGRVSGFQVEREPFAMGDVIKGFGVGGRPLPQTDGNVGSSTNVDSWVVGINWSPIANAKVLLNYGENDFGPNYVGTLGADTRKQERFVILSTQVNF